MSTDIIPSDSPSVFDVVNALSDLRRQAIIRPDNPPPGIAGFLFDIPEDDEITLESDITDHYIGNNTSIADNIALRPERYTVRGLVAEIAAITPVADKLAVVPETLPVNPALVPGLSPQASQTEDDIVEEDTSAEAAIGGSQSLYQYYSTKYDSITPPPSNPSKQAKVLGYFYQLWKGRQRFTVETPWGTFTNMAIMMVRASQDDESRFKSSFSLTFKKIRTTSQITVNLGLLAGRAALQQAPVTQQGTSGQTSVSAADRASLLSRLFSP